MVPVYIGLWLVLLGPVVESMRAVLNLNPNRHHSSGTRTRCLVNLVPRECTVASTHTASTPKLWARIGRDPVLLDFARKSPPAPVHKQFE